MEDMRLYDPLCSACNGCKSWFPAGGPFTDVCPACYSSNPLRATLVGPVRIRGGFAL